MIKMFQVMFGFIILSIVMNILLSFLLFLTYTNLTAEQVVAKLTFEASPDISNQYTAKLYDAEDDEIDSYTLHGNQWRIDAAFIKLEYFANVFGGESKYALDRIEGRYKDINDQNTQKHVSYQIESHDLAETMSFFIDTSYGSSVYKDILLNTEFTILKSPTGLLVREKTIPLQKEETYWEQTKGMFQTLTD